MHGGVLIQINFLGYPGTMGAEFMDYMIADGTVIPRAQQVHYAEKIIYLPNSFMPFDSSYAISERTFTRQEMGLPPEGFVFCCFNNNNKITPAVFDRVDADSEPGARAASCGCRRPIP